MFYCFSPECTASRVSIQCISLQRHFQWSLVRSSPYRSLISGAFLGRPVQVVSHSITSWQLQSYPGEVIPESLWGEVIFKIRLRQNQERQYELYIIAKKLSLQQIQDLSSASTRLLILH